MKRILFLIALPVFAQNAFYLDLKGEWKVIHEDRPEFARPDFDDHAWQSVTLPTGEEAIFQRAGGWLRKKVELPESAYSRNWRSLWEPSKTFTRSTGMAG